MSEPTEGNGGVHQRSSHPVYVELHDSADFAELRRRFRNFVFPATIVFMAWYLLYVILSNWAGGFMNTQVIGNVNIALVFGLLQFASTFLIAILYGRYMEKNTDPLARKIEKLYDEEISRGGAPR